MTNTKIVTAGVLAAAGANISNAVKVALGATTTRFTLEAIITNGAVGEPTSKLRVGLHFATSNATGTAAAEVPALVQGSQAKHVDIKTEPLAVSYIATKDFFPNGSNIFVWLETPKLPAAAAVDVWLNELT